MPWNTVANSEMQAGAPARGSVIQRIYNNIIELVTGTDVNAPKIPTGAIADNAITKEKLAEVITPGFNQLLFMSFDQTEIGTSWTKLYEARIALDATFRAVIRADSDSSNDYVRVRIYKNGAAFGTQLTANDNSNEVHVENLSYAAGDTIEFYAVKENSGAVCNGSFQLGYDLATSSVFQLFADINSTS